MQKKQLEQEVLSLSLCVLPVMAVYSDKGLATRDCASILNSIAKACRMIFTLVYFTYDLHGNVTMWEVVRMRKQYMCASYLYCMPISGTGMWGQK